MRHPLSPSRRRAAWLAAGALLCAAPLLFGAEAQTIIENLKSSLQRHPNGRVRTLLTAERAELPDDDTIHGFNVELTVYTPDGELQSRLESDEVIIDKSRNTGHCPGSASFERHAPTKRGAAVEENGVSIAGRDVYWVGDASRLSVSNDVVLVIYRQGKTIAEGWR